jgi:hypothetical protein
MWDKADTAQILLKLIDACTQCRRIFEASTSPGGNPVRPSIIEDVQNKLEQFGLELRNEIRRLGEHEDLCALRFESLPQYSGDVALSHVLDCYQQAFSSRLTAHTRAMLNRQYSELFQSYDELGSAKGAA